LRVPPRFVGIGLGLALAGCGLSVDAEQARICRLALPALNPEGRVSVLRVTPWLEAQTLRIDYGVEREGRPRLERTVLCRFAASGLSANKAELMGLSTETGPLSGATLYLLKRFYIESAEGVANDPGAGEPSSGLLEVPPSVAYGLQQFLSGLPRTAIYGLLALAYALVFGLVGRINLAFGELAAVGAAGATIGVTIAIVSGGSAPVTGLGLGFLSAAFTGATYGAVSGHFAISRVRGETGQPSLIATVGLSLALMEFLRLAQGPATVWFAPIWSHSVGLMRSGAFVASVTPRSLATSAVGLSVGLAILAYMRRSAFGRRWRAYADDAAAASLYGVDAGRLLTTSLALSGGLAGLAGALIVTQYGGLGFAGGFGFGLKALIAAVLGGIGSVPGAFVGGLALGLFETVWSMLMPIDARDIALYALLVAVLVFCPNGCLATRALTPRQV
jgi:branched-chain amino acid transport system permease protein